MYEVYGQTENTGLATAMPPNRIKLGTVGVARPETEVRLSPQGEILLRGPHVFLGYYGKPDKTAETIVDGWLHTGDVGTIDADGFVRITDRMKDIIITAGGKNVTPSEIENQLKFSPFISDAVVIGDQRRFLSCLVMIDHETVAQFAQERNVPFSNFASLCRARGGAGPHLERDRAREPAARAGGDHQGVPADRAAPHRRGRGADADHEAEAHLRQREVQGSRSTECTKGATDEEATGSQRAGGRGGRRGRRDGAEGDPAGSARPRSCSACTPTSPAPPRPYGVSSSNAVKMRFDEVNEKGGIHGRKIRLDRSRTPSTRCRAPVQAGDQARSSATASSPWWPALGTPMNNALFKDQFDAGVPNLFPLSAARSMYEPFHKLKFYGAASYVDQVRAGINYFVTKKGKKALCAMYQDTDFGKEVLDGVQVQAEKMKLKIVETVTHKPTDQDFTRPDHQA